MKSLKEPRRDSTTLKNIPDPPTGLSQQSEEMLHTPRSGNKSVGKLLNVHYTL